VHAARAGLLTAGLALGLLGLIASHGLRGASSVRPIPERAGDDIEQGASSELEALHGPGVRRALEPVLSAGEPIATRAGLRTLVVRLDLADGAPFPEGVEVVLRQGARRIAQLPVGLDTASTRFRHLAPGPYLVRALPPRGWSTSAPCEGAWSDGRDVWRAVEVTGPTAATTVTLRLTPAASAAGVLLDAYDRPAVGREVRLATADEPGTFRTTLTDVEGRFRFDDLAPGGYALLAVPPVQVFELTPGENAWLELRERPARARVVGRVVDAQGLAVGGLRVEAVDPAASRHAAAVRARSRTDGEGFFALDELPTGSVVIRVAPRESWRRASGARRVARAFEPLELALVVGELDVGTLVVEPGELSVASRR